MDQKKNKILGIKIGIGAAATIIFFLVLYMLRPFKRYTGRLPFIPNKSFNRTLWRYITTRPTRHVFFVTGEKQSGKSRSLDHVASQLSSEGYLVINLDPVACQSFTEFLELFKVSVIKALVTVKPTLSTAQLKSIGDLPIDRNISGPIPEFSDPVLAKPYQLVAAAIDTILLDNLTETGLYLLFDSFEKFSDLLYPIIIIHNVDNIIELPYQSNGKISLKLKVFNSLVSLFSRRDQYDCHVPIMLEIQNSLFRLYKNDLSTSFRYLSTDQLQDTYKHFVIRNKAFKKSEYKLITKRIGNHAGSFVRIFEDVRYGIPVSKSIENIENEVERDIKSIIKINEKTLELASKICKGNGEVNLINSTEPLIISGLFEKGYLTLKRNLLVKTMNNAVTNVLCSLK